MAQIIFLGTAGSSAVVSKQLRASGGIVIKVGDLQFHIDPGPGALQKAKEYSVNLNHNTAILVSHNHVNHCNDLNVVVDAMTHGGIEHRGILLASKSVLEESDESQPYLTKHHRKLLEKIISMDKNHKVAVELVEINALPAEHTDKAALGFKFFCPKFTLSYTGDTIVTAELLDALNGTDILILNVPFPGSKSAYLNLDTEAAIRIISHVRPKLAILTHFGMEMLKADPLVEAREVQRITGVQTIAAQDGLLISPEGYGTIHSPVRGFD
jgi:ribonuclease BN (tRNA processing enzyme)